MVSYGSEDYVITILPPGKREDDYEITFEIMVSDSLSAATNIELKIKVRTRACHVVQVASWLVSLIPDREVWVSSPSRGHCVVTLYSHSTSISPPKCTKGIVEFHARLVTLRWTSIPSSGSSNTSSRFMLKNRDKRRPGRPLGSCAGFYLTRACRG